MSTVIGNGYIINKKFNLYELNKFINQLRIDINEISNELYTKLVAEKFVYIYDNILLNKYYKLDNTFLSIYDKNILDKKYFYPELQIIKIIKDEIKNPYNGLFTDFDINVNIVIYPLKDKLLFQIFSTKSEYIQNILKKYDFIKEYFYWNNTDKEEDISEKEWVQREKDWNEVFDFSSIPKFSGFCIEFIEPVALKLNKKTFSKYISDYDSRIIYYAKERVMDKIEKSFSNIMDSYEIINDKFKSKESKKEIEENIKLFKTIISKDIDYLEYIYQIKII